MAGLKADRELKLRFLSSVAIVLVILWGISTGGLVWTFIAGAIDDGIPHDFLGLDGYGLPDGLCLE